MELDIMQFYKIELILFEKFNSALFKWVESISTWSHFLIWYSVLINYYSSLHLVHQFCCKIDIGFDIIEL